MQSQLSNAILQKISVCGGVMINPSIHLTFLGVKNYEVTVFSIMRHLKWLVWMMMDLMYTLRGVRGVESQFFSL